MSSTDGIKKVWNVTIGKKMDCVIMTDFEAMQVKMKFMPNINMTDMTTAHNIQPDMFNKSARESQLLDDYPFSFSKQYDYEKWRYKTTWTFESLMEM